MPEIDGAQLTEEQMQTLREAIVSRFVTDPWTRKAIHAALKAGRVEELWPGASFWIPEDSNGNWGRLQFADGGRVKINFGSPA